MNRRIALALTLFFLPAPAAAQLATTTSLVGTVTDDSGAGIVGAQITAVNEATTDTYSAATNAQGSYTLPFVRIGTYTITVEMAGFDPTASSGVLVETNQTVRTNFTLQVGGVAQEVTVTGTQPLLTTDEPSVSEVLTTRDIATLPLTGRDVLKLATTTAGVRLNGDSPNGVPPGETFTGAGVRNIQNDVSLDGISVMNNLITTVNFRPSAEAVSEMHVQTGTYAAQYGNYLGVHMNVVTKSGTNQMHGALFEYFRNDALEARDYFDDPESPKNPLRQNQFGVEVDGPVVIPGVYNGRNKTFFMGSYEGLRLRSESTAIQSVLTPKMRQGDFSEVATPLADPTRPGTLFPGNVIPEDRLSPQALRLLEFMPLPNAAGTVDNFINIDSTQNYWDQLITRVDENVSDDVRLSFRYSYLNGRPSSTSLDPYSGAFTPNTQTNFLVGYTHILTPSMVNDFRFGRNSVQTDTVNIFFERPELQQEITDIGIPGFGFTRADDPGLANFNLSQYNDIGGGTNWFQSDETWQFSNNLSLTKGAHTFMMGMEFARLRTDRTAANDARGRFNFTGELTSFGELSGFDAADFLLGMPRSSVTGAPQLASAGQQWRGAFFFQDKWDLTRNLTLNLGLRYEIPTVPTTPTGNATILNAEQTELIPADAPQPGFEFTDPDHNNWAPRIGFAYRMGENWVARGGFGLYYNANQTNSYTLLSLNPPFSNFFTFDSDPTNPTVTLANPTPSGAETDTPAADVITVGPDWPTAMMRQWSLDLQRALWSGAALDLQYLGSSSRNLDTSFYNNTPLPGPGSVQSRRPNPRWGNIRWIFNEAISNYNALNVILRQRLNNGVSFLASYTWAHTLDQANNSNAGGRPMNPYDWDADYGNANWDLRHRFVISYSYDLPFFGEADSAFVRAIAGGWQASGVTTLESGLPFNVTIAGDIANTGSPNQRPDLVGTATADCGADRLTNCITASAFAEPEQYTYGNAGRNILRGPGMVVTDFAFRKNFTLNQGLNVLLGIEVFNLFNTPTFSNPRSVFGDETFGRINSTRSTPRQMQLAAKFWF
ncbi:MAG: hypothetical protein GEV06_09520 [Luteitalea sp.]|nr:hypothetical protein [Luteitalea sp.]